MTAGGLTATLLAVGVVGAGAVAWVLSSGGETGSPGFVAPVRSTDAGPRGEARPLAPADGAVESLASGPAPTLPAPDTSDVDDVGPDPPREKDIYAELMALARDEGAEALVTRVEDLLGSDAPDAEKVAGLRAVRDVGSPEAGRLFLWALSHEPAEDGRHGVAIPTFVLGDLDKRSASDPDARAALRAVAVGEVLVPEARLRRRAASRLAQVGTVDDLLVLRASLRPDDEKLLLRGIAVGLKLNPRGPDVEQAFAGLLPPVTIDGEQTDG